MMVYGALTPWRGEWVWSGQQEPFGNVPEHEEDRLRQEMLETASAIAYRYCADEAAQALEFTREHHMKFVAHHGDELVVFPDGLEMAAAEQKRMEAEWRMANPEHVARVMRERGLEHPRPRMKLPPEVLSHDQGIGVFSNPDEGQEMALRFNLVLSGLRKKGVGIPGDETETLRRLVTDAAISPAFVRRLVAEHGMESLAETFLLRQAPPAQTLEFLLRRHKGRFYRKRYPSLALLQGTGKPGGQ